MIDRSAFVQAAKKLLVALEGDLRERAAVEPYSGRFRDEYAQAQEKGRTAADYDSWLDERLTQIGAAWILACVFLRFLEDNDFLPAPLLAGPSDRLKRAGEHREGYFRANPAHSDREFLESLLRDLAHLPGMRELLDEATNPLWQLGPSADGARLLVDFFRGIDPDSGDVRWAFRHEDADTRFLGDLYQDLSEAARKRYALLQTPEFIEKFILDWTLEPAVAEFGLERTTVIDPTCGSGHFLLGAFDRLHRRWLEEGSSTTPAARVQRALDAISGVDVNPFAVAIARFRLLLKALRAAECHRLADAPDFHFHLAAGDSLLHGRRPEGKGEMQSSLFEDDLASVYEVEDKEALREILGRSYAAVVGNPPYITVKDKALNAGYRERFPQSCHRQYSLAVPFKERFVDLATGDDGTAGFWGMITANSFMKREFGKKLIEQLMPRWDLTHVIDTSGAYIPGHGTPTVILVGRARKPVAQTVRAAMGIRGEPGTPANPATGRVWSEIVRLLGHPGTTGDFVSIDDVDRSIFENHPWSLGGGGAGALKQLIERSAPRRLRELVLAIGRTTVVGEDDAWVMDRASADRLRLSEYVVPFVVGEAIRDWVVHDTPVAVYPYRSLGGEVRGVEAHQMLRFLWPNRTILSKRSVFGKAITDGGRKWWEHLEHYANKLRDPLSIAFAHIATHNHFALDQGGKVFKQSAPVIKLSSDANQNDHVSIVGVLNSSLACFWLKQVCHCKGAQGINEGGKEEKWEQFFDHDATKLRSFPMPEDFEPSVFQRMARLVEEADNLRPSAVLHDASDGGVLARSKALQGVWLRRAVAIQEEVDWYVYRAYGLTEEDLCTGHGVAPEVKVGERAFEIFLARRISEGKEQTEWFARHGATPITEVPEHWPEPYRKIVERRIELIEADRSIGLIERPEYKRRWSTESWESQEERALRGWLLDHIERISFWSEHRLITAAALAERLRDDGGFMQVAALYRKRDDFDLAKLVTELVLAEGVPYLAALRYKDPGLRKRAAWETTWALQREEDAAEARGETFAKKIPVPPKYKSSDFTKQSYWSHRGKLDVPKERFILYPDAERKGEAGPLLGWAGWDEKERCIALFSWLTERKDSDGWGKDELAPLLAGVLELLPWLKQWHDEPEPGKSEGFASEIERIFDEDVRNLSLTREDLMAWRPPKKTHGRRKKKA
jgi:Domain of unknown function (DUF7008)/Eco57I restriction-modification methylase